MVINGVDVTAYVNERDPWYPLRAMLRPPDPEGMRAAWAALEAEWAKTIARAQALPEAALHESVDGEWSFVQTLRHLVFAMDKWFTAPILGEGFHPIGLPNSGSVDFPWPGLDYDLTPSVADALAVRADRAARFRDYLASVATDRLHATGRRARERHQPAAGVHLHRLRGRVLAQPLRRARPRPAGSVGRNWFLIAQVGVMPSDAATAGRRSFQTNPSYRMCSAPKNRTAKAYRPSKCDRVSSTIAPIATKYSEYAAARRPGTRDRCHGCGIAALAKRAVHDGEVLDGVGGDIPGDTGNRVDHDGDDQAGSAERIPVLRAAGCATRGVARPDPSARRRPRRPTRRPRKIERQSAIDESQKADIIVVLGAAEYNGRPSPVLRARLDHAFDLYSQGMAQLILTTGGAGGDEQFTEGQVGRDYLVRRGIPSERIVVEGEGDTTVSTVLAVSEIMRRMGLTSAILVSDEAITSSVRSESSSTRA